MTAKADLNTPEHFLFVPLVARNTETLQPGLNTHFVGLPWVAIKCDKLTINRMTICSFHTFTIPKMDTRI